MEVFLQMETMSSTSFVPPQILSLNHSINSFSSLRAFYCKLRPMLNKKLISVSTNDTAK